MLEDMKKWADDLAKMEREHSALQTRVLELETERDAAKRQLATALTKLEQVRNASGILNGVDEMALMDTGADIEFRRSLTSPDMVIIRGHTKRSSGPTLAVALKDYFRAIGHEQFAQTKAKK